MGVIVQLIYLAIVIITIAGMWKCFEKAGHPGWAALVPFYNLYIILTIIGKPVWWIVLCLIPLINLIVIIIIYIEFAKKFGKSGAFGLLCLIGVGFAILGFTDAKYTA
jgi:uncharacterized membrane protein YhaH (DUF805 family)